MLVVLRTSASPGFNDLSLEFQHRKNKTSGEFDCGTLSMLGIQGLMIFCVLNDMQMHIFIMDECMFATGMRNECICWRHFFKEVFLVSVCLHSTDFI